jgi:hypothetical protein
MLTILVCLLFQSDDTFKKKQTIKEEKEKLVYRSLSGEFAAAERNEYWIAKDKSIVEYKQPFKTLICDSSSTLENRWLKLIQSKDTEAIEEFSKSKQCFILEGPCKVQVLQSFKLSTTTAIAEIRILEGDNEVINKTGWVPVNVLCERIKKQVIVERLMTKDEIKRYRDRIMAEHQKGNAEDEAKASELLKAANRWLARGNKDLARERVQELIRRFPNSNAAKEAKDMKLDE